jgi:hypothetical protein
LSALLLKCVQGTVYKYSDLWHYIYK